MRHSKYYTIFLTIFFFLIVGYLYRDNVFAIRFVDEEYNLAIGKYLIQQEILYKGIITNHQPITHILSGLVQAVTNPNSVYSLILTHRVVILLWSMLWAIILVLRYRWIGLVFVVIYELTKSNLFGNLFLAEAFSVYPLIFLIGQVLMKEGNWNKWEGVAAGFSLSFLALTLGPLWPVLGFLFILLLYKLRHSLKSTLFYLLIGALIVILPILKFVSVLGYLKIYLLLNLKYTIPSQTGTYYPEGWYLTIIKSFISPILSFTNNEISPFIWVIKSLSILFIISLIFLIHQRKYFQAIIYFLLLGLTNIRFIDPGTDSFMRFHLLPWYASLIFITVQLFTKKTRGIYVVLIICTLIFALIYAKSDFGTKRNPQKDFEINFSTFVDRGNTIKAMRSKEDSLFVSPDNWLIYWAADTNHLPKLFGYYAWMAGIPALHNQILESFDKTPPTFFYCDNCKDLDLEKFLIKYKKTSDPYLYVLNK